MKKLQDAWNQTRRAATIRNSECSKLRSPGQMIHWRCHKNFCNTALSSFWPLSTLIIEWVSLPSNSFHFWLYNFSRPRDLSHQPVSVQGLFCTMWFSTPTVRVLVRPFPPRSCPQRHPWWATTPAVIYPSLHIRAPPTGVCGNLVLSWIWQ